MTVFRLPPINRAGTSDRIKGHIQFDDVQVKISLSPGLNFGTTTATCPAPLFQHGHRQSGDVGDADGPSATTEATSSFKSLPVNGQPHLRHPEREHSPE